MVILRAVDWTPKKQKLKPKFKEKIQHQGVKSLNLTKTLEKTKFAYVSHEIEFLL